MTEKNIQKTWQYEKGGESIPRLYKILFVHYHSIEIRNLHNYKTIYNTITKEPSKAAPHTRSKKPHKPNNKQEYGRPQFLKQL